MKSPKGLKVLGITPSSAGFGEYECSGAVFVRKESVRPHPAADGLIRNQTGLAITAETLEGEPVLGMLT